jgi:Pescadillo N-terminus
MGNRIKGKAKKKSIKAAIGSSVGSKRKLSRMGKNQKKHHRGLEATFIGRSRCLKLLQINLKDFRRLCILKGIYPREPLNGRVPNKNKGQSYYHIKDVKSISHEPILEKFREFKAFMKKVRPVYNFDNILGKSEVILILTICCFLF